MQQNVALLTDFWNLVIFPGKNLPSRILIFKFNGGGTNRENIKININFLGYQEMYVSLELMSLKTEISEHLYKINM